MIKHVLQKSVSKLKEILLMLTTIGETKLVSSIREKIYQVEKEKKVERRKKLKKLIMLLNQYLKK